MSQCNQANQSKAHPQQVSERMARIMEIARQAAQLGQGALRERVAVPDGSGGYKMVVRDIKY